jgi:hypothetical protein
MGIDGGNNRDIYYVRLGSSILWIIDYQLQKTRINFINSLSKKCSILLHQVPLLHTSPNANILTTYGITAAVSGTPSIGNLIPYQSKTNIYLSTNPKINLSTHPNTPTNKIPEKNHKMNNTKKNISKYHSISKMLKNNNYLIKFNQILLEILNKMITKEELHQHSKNGQNLRKILKGNNIKHNKIEKKLLIISNKYVPIHEHSLTRNSKIILPNLHRNAMGELIPTSQLVGSYMEII